MLRKINTPILFSIIALFGLLMFSFYRPVATVSADHGSCNQGSADAIATCIQSAREADLEACRGQGSPDSIENCTTNVREHYETRPVDGNGEAPDPGSYEGECKAPPGGELSKENCGIIAYLATFIRVLSAMVGIVVTIMIVWGGIMYASSRDNPQQTASAKSHIVNALIALMAYIFIVAVLNWLVPGGVF